MPTSKAPGRSPRRSADPPNLLVGEVRTTLLQNSHQASADVVSRLLDLDPSSRVRVATRPFAHAISPDERIGVHCPLATGTGTSADGAGVVLTRASITGGIVLQASARARVVRAAGDRRLPWSHYIAHPGFIEVDGRCTGDDLATGFLQPTVQNSVPGRSPAPLDMGAMGNRLIDRVQRMPYIDRVTMLRARRTKFRFAVTWMPPDTHEPAINPVRDVELVIHDETLRTLRMRLVASACDPAEVTAACEDLALHDWLLSTIAVLVENSRIGVDPAAEVIARIRPAIDNLLHLWMPGAGVAGDLAAVWSALERRPGFSRQWMSLRGQIQSQLLLAILEKSGSSRGAEAFQDPVDEFYREA
ncbi:hypothetical protein CcI49_09940 [Frankia sp. CcI49]|uniref:SCO2521 family protein n=1 Tax=Frankia sp. CcI49 TaxID=1745382 RepID=UPI0009764173|nr:SCO2521 family protein [Frankia sp. CcI49]ONH60888.1 hypothetical protein CcI49_09940 [Frankia sp. CcI49]